MRRKSSLALPQSELFAEDDANPMETVANLSDVMLVLAVALMIAIITRYNVNVTADVEDVPDAVETETTDLSADSLSGSGFTIAGTAYTDEEGNTYIVKPKED